MPTRELRCHSYEVIRRNFGTGLEWRRTVEEWWRRKRRTFTRSQRRCVLQWKLGKCLRRRRLYVSTDVTSPSRATRGHQHVSFISWVLRDLVTWHSCVWCGRRPIWLGALSMQDHLRFVALLSVKMYCTLLSCSRSGAISILKLMAQSLFCWEFFVGVLRVYEEAQPLSAIGL